MVFFKKYGVNFLLTILFLVFMFSTSAKVIVIKGLMQVGLMRVNVDETKPEALKTPSVRFLDVKKQQIVDVADLKGKVVFINFWATWCPPCLAELPSIQKLYLEFEHDPNVVFLMVEVDGNAAGAEKLYQSKGFTFPLLVPKSDIPEQLLSGAIPTTIVLNKKGQIALRKEGGANYHSRAFVKYLKAKATE